MRQASFFYGKLLTDTIYQPANAELMRCVFVTVFLQDSPGLFSGKILLEPSGTKQVNQSPAFASAQTNNTKPLFIKNRAKTLQILVQRPARMV